MHCRLHRPIRSSSTSSRSGSRTRRATPMPGRPQPCTAAGSQQIRFRPNLPSSRPSAVGRRRRPSDARAECCCSPLSLAAACSPSEPSQYAALNEHLVGCRGLRTTYRPPGARPPPAHRTWTAGARSRSHTSQRTRPASRPPPTAPPTPMASAASRPPTFLRCRCGGWLGLPALGRPCRHGTAGCCVRRSRHGLLRPCTPDRHECRKASQSLRGARDRRGRIAACSGASVACLCASTEALYCRSSSCTGSTGCICCDRQRWARLAPHCCGRACSLRPA